MFPSKSTSVSVNEKPSKVWFPVFKILIVKVKVSPTPILPSLSLSVASTVLVTVSDGLAGIIVSIFSDDAVMVPDWASSVP